MKPLYVIVKDRVMLRPLEERDLEIVRQWRNQDHIRVNFVHSSYITREEQKKWYQVYLQRDNDLMFIIEDAGEIKRPVGTAALYHIDCINLKAEFGRLMIGHAGVRRKGMAFKATRLLCRFAFKILGLKEIYLRVFSGNRPAVGLYQKAGFKLVDCKDTATGETGDFQLLCMKLTLENMVM